MTPRYIKFTALRGTSFATFYGLPPDDQGWSRLVGWYDGKEEDPHRYQRALGAGVRHSSGMSDIVPLEQLPPWAQGDLT